MQARAADVVEARKGREWQPSHPASSSWSPLGVRVPGVLVIGRRSLASHRGDASHAFQASGDEQRVADRAVSTAAAVSTCRCATSMRPVASSTWPVQRPRKPWWNTPCANSSVARRRRDRAHRRHARRDPPGNYAATTRFADQQQIEILRRSVNEDALLRRAGVLTCWRSTPPSTVRLPS
jgi:hypothetical protein